MKNHLFAALAVTLWFGDGAPLAQSAEPVLVDRGIHHRVWQRETPVLLPGGRTFNRVSRTIELAHGMHSQRDGQLLVSQEVIELFEDGAVGRQGLHQVIFAPNLATPGAIDIATPDGHQLRSHVLGLGLFDTASGRSVLLAEVKDSIGQLHAPNLIAYPDPFDDVAAELRYTYRRSGISQDVLLKQLVEVPPGFNEASTLLEIWTEFINPPDPIIFTSEKDGRIDETLDFGAMRIGAGRAFSLNGGGRSIPVTKRWMTIENRIFLIEAVRVTAANAELARMGLQQALAAPQNKNRMTLVARNSRPFPKAPSRKEARRKIETAALAVPVRGLLVDYELSSVYGALTLQADTDYHVTGDITVTNLVIEGGTVVKFNNNCQITVPASGTVDCQTDPYRPAIFTTRDDDAVGAVATGSTGNPSAGSFGAYAFLLFQGASQLSNVRFAYGNPGIHYDYNSGNHTLHHAQFVHCPTAIWIEDYSTLALGNGLIYNADTAIYGINYSGKVENLTVQKCKDFSYDAVASAPIALTNCLLVNVTNWGNASITTNLTVKVSGNDILQTVGGGSHYLATNSPYRDIGTPNVSAALLSDLKRSTTYPPIVIESANWYTNNLNLLPQARRDTDSIDIGFHYWPLDFVLGGVRFTNATLVASNGVVIGTRNIDNHGIGLAGAATLISVGKAESPNRFVRFNTVQEQATTNWASAPEVRIYTGWPSAVTPQIKARFTHWSTTASGGEHLYLSDQDVGTHSFTHSEFHAGEIYCQNPTLSLTNCLLNRSSLSMVDDAGSINPTVAHCTIRGGSHSFLRQYSGTWTFRDNLFDNVAIPIWSVVVAHTNAYTTNSVYLTNNALGNIFLTVSNVTYRAGTLGRFYLPTNVSSHAPLLNTTGTAASYSGGSTLAHVLGFYSFTSITNQLRETNTVVDLGYHYVSTDSNGLPLDLDSDGWPDYWEDANGDGTLNSGETKTDDAQDAGLKVFITRPTSGRQLP